MFASPKQPADGRHRERHEPRKINGCFFLQLIGVLRIIGSGAHVPRLHIYVVITLFCEERTLKRQLASLLAGLLVAVIAAPTFGSITKGCKSKVSGADPEYLITFNGSDNDVTITGSGTIDATPNGDGSYTAIAGSITFTSGPDTGTFGLFPKLLGTSPSGAFYYDNQLTPTAATGGILDIDGLLFINGATEINLWGNGRASLIRLIVGLRRAVIPAKLLVRSPRLRPRQRPRLRLRPPSPARSSSGRCWAAWAWRLDARGGGRLPSRPIGSIVTEQSPRRVRRGFFSAHALLWNHIAEITPGRSQPTATSGTEGASNINMYFYLAV